MSLELASERAPQNSPRDRCGFIVRGVPKQHIRVPHPSAWPAASLRGRAARVQNRKAHGCAGAAQRMDGPVRRSGERPPDDFVELGVLI